MTFYGWYYVLHDLFEEAGINIGMYGDPATNLEHWQTYYDYTFTPQEVFDEEIVLYFD